MQSFVFNRIYHNLVALFLSYCSQSSTLFPVMRLCAPGRHFRVVGISETLSTFGFIVLDFLLWYFGFNLMIDKCISSKGLFFANTHTRNLRVKINLYCRDICMNIVNTWDTHIRVTPNHTSLKGFLIACAIVFVQVVGVCWSDGTPAAHLNVLG